VPAGSDTLKELGREFTAEQHHFAEIVEQPQWRPREE